MVSDTNLRIAATVAVAVKVESDSSSAVRTPEGYFHLALRSPLRLHGSVASGATQEGRELNSVIGKDNVARPWVARKIPSR